MGSHLPSFWLKFQSLKRIDGLIKTKSKFDAAIQVIAYLSSAHPDGGSPEGLHGQGDEAGDGVSQGQMKHKKVDVGATSKNLKMFQKKLEKGFFKYRKCLFRVSSNSKLNTQFRYVFIVLSTYASCLDFFREHSRVYYLSQCHFD